MLHRIMTSNDLLAAGELTVSRCASRCLPQEAIYGDFALVKAWKGDTEGNLVYRKTARNHNPAIATAGKITIAEVGRQR